MHSTCKCGGRIRPKDPSVAQPATATYPHVTYRTERITQEWPRFTVTGAVGFSRNGYGKPRGGRGPSDEDPLRGRGASGPQSSGRPMRSTTTTTTTPPRLKLILGHSFGIIVSHNSSLVLLFLS